MSELIRQAVQAKIQADLTELKLLGYEVMAEWRGDELAVSVNTIAKPLMLPAPAGGTVIVATPGESADLAAAASSSKTKNSTGRRPRGAAASGKKLCKVVDCDRPSVAREMCSKHYSKWLYDSKK